MMDLSKQKNILVPIVIALLSFFLLGSMTTSTSFHEKSIQSLDEKKTTVMELTAAATASSAAITMIPGDVGTPIAEELAELSSQFLIVLGAIYLEKYLLTITGFLAFKVLIPLGCVFWIVSMIRHTDKWKKLAIKLSLLALAIFAAIPASVFVSDMVENTYESSIQSTIDAAKETTDELDKIEKEKGGLESFFNNITGGVAKTVDAVQSSLNNFVEALAVMIVTSCVIPMLVLFFFVWLAKLIIGIELDVSQYKPKLSSQINQSLTPLKHK